MKRIMCVWLPNWPIQRLVNERTELKKRPIALYESGGRGGLQVSYASTAARQQGVEVGASVADALARLGKRLHLAAYDPLLCNRALVELAQRCERFSPIVGVEEVGVPAASRTHRTARAKTGAKTGAKTARANRRAESLLLDATGLGPLFGGEAELTQLVSKTLRQWGFWARIAVAPTVGAAWAFSHCVSTDREPFGAADDFTDHLKSLPLAALRLSDATLESLFDLGLQTIGDLLALPRESVASRFSPELLYRFNQTLGDVKESIQPVKQPETYRATWDFFYPTNKRAAIHTIVRQLTDHLATSLAEANRGALEVVLRMTCERASDSAATVADFEVGLYRPCASAKHLYELLELKLEQARFPSSVISIALEATRTSLVAPEQKELFADESRGHRQEFTVLVNQLASRLGERAVVRPVLYANAQPERACREVPLVHSLSSGRRGAKSVEFAPLERPMFLFRRPLPIEVTAVSSDGYPRSFIWNRNNYEIFQAIGPERIETSWWGKQGVRRDYFRVDTSSGWFWIFRQRGAGSWFLHGEFE